MTKFSFNFDTETSKEPEPFGHALGLFIRQWEKEIGIDRLRLADELEWQANWQRYCHAGERMDALNERLGHE